MLDTSRVEGRRTLRLATLDDLLADARALAAADRAGTLGRLGNWTLGQALNHLAAWIEYPYIGYPAELVIPPDMVKDPEGLKRRMMTETMTPGVSLPGLESSGGTLATQVVPTGPALSRLESAAARLRAGDPPVPDPAFGPLTAHELTQMTLRHAELHLSFFKPR